MFAATLVLERRCDRAFGQEIGTRRQDTHTSGVGTAVSVISRMSRVQKATLLTCRLDS